VTHGSAAAPPALAGEIPGVKAAVTPAAVQASNNVISGLTAALRTLLQLTDEQPSLLGAELDRMLADAEALDQELTASAERRDEMAAEMEARAAAAEELKGEWQRMIASLRLYRQADHDLAEALSSAGVPADVRAGASTQATVAATDGGAQAVPPDSGLARVRAALADIADRLADADQQLKPILQAHAEIYRKATAVRSW
jgi:hypothetical protein